jgi:hypothetical protein
MEPAQALFERINLVEAELARSDVVDALEHVEEPSARRRRFFSQEDRLPLLAEDVSPFGDDPVANDVYFSGFRNA